MGYRSEVVLVVDKRVEGMLMHVFTSQPTAHQMCYEYADVHEDREDAVMFRWTYAKWYDSYPDVNAIENFMNKLDSADNIEIDGEEIDLCYMYRFVRVGEDADDIECRGYGFDSIYPVATINVDF